MENQIERLLVKEIEKMGGKCLKLVNQGANNFPDRTILLPGAYIALAECKDKGKDLRETQQWYRDEVLMPLGFKVFRVRTIEDIEQIKQHYNHYIVFNRIARCRRPKRRKYEKMDS